MKSKIFHKFALCAFACSLLLVWALAAAQSPVPAEHSKDLHGTWIVTISLVNCQSGHPMGNPFLSLLTFGTPGTLIETTSNPNFYPAERGPGHGSWKETGEHQYKASSMAFITLNGQLTSTQVITQKIVLDGDVDKFTTTSAKIQFFDPNGNLLRTGCAVATGQRFE